MYTLNAYLRKVTKQRTEKITLSSLVLLNVLNLSNVIYLVYIMYHVNF